MLRPILGFAALGIGAYVGLKLLALVLPALAVLVGLVFFGLKILLVALAVYVLYRLLRRPSGSGAEASGEQP